MTYGATTIALSSILAVAGVAIREEKPQVLAELDEEITRRAGR